jgi:hypothetical protein
MVLDMDGYVDPYEEVVAEDDSDNPDEDDSNAESNYKDKSFDLLKSDKHRVRNPDDTFRGPFCPCKKSRGTRARSSVVLKTPELIRRNVVVKDPAEVSRSQDAADVHTTEVTGVCGCSIHLPRFQAEFLLGGFYLL